MNSLYKSGAQGNDTNGLHSKDLYNNEKQFLGTAELKINKACGPFGWKSQRFEMLKSSLTVLQNVTLFRNRIIADVISLK